MYTVTYNKLGKPQVEEYTTYEMAEKVACRNFRRHGGPVRVTSPSGDVVFEREF